MNKKPTITEIRSYLAKHGATLKRARFTLNSRPAYVVTFPNGRMSTYTDAGLIQAYMHGVFIDGLSKVTTGGGCVDG